MRTIAEGLTEDEAARLAAALASRPWREEGYGGDPRRIAEGAAIVARYECASCHGTEYAGAGVVPRTAGQRAPYLERQLAGFADGSRFHPPTGTGARMYSMTAREAAATAQFLASLAPSPAPAGAVDLAWLAGYWCARSEGTDSEELWLAPRGGLMLGLHRDSAAGKATGFEFLRIEYQGDRATLLAQPGGRAPATAFELAERGPARAVFANPAHDYPKRITYQRLGEDTLLASIEGGEGTEAQRWTWTRDCR